MSYNFVFNVLKNKIKINKSTLTKKKYGFYTLTLIRIKISRVPFNFSFFHSLPSTTIIFLFIIYYLLFILRFDKTRERTHNCCFDFKEKEIDI